MLKITLVFVAWVLAGCVFESMRWKGGDGGQ